MIWDSNADFWIIRIAPKMKWIHSLVGVRHFAKFHEKTACMRNTNKSHKIPYSAMLREVET